MTHKEKLSELTARIREVLPRLKEIQRGYKFLHIPKKRLGISVEYEVLDVYGGMQIADTGDCSDSYCIVVSGYDGVEDGWLYEDVEGKGIIGCEPMINDVLEWLGKTLQPERYSKEIALNHLGNFIVLDYGVNGFTLLRNPKVDLSKPYLKDQSKELIDYLWGLKKWNVSNVETKYILIWQLLCMMMEIFWQKKRNNEH